jgi:hypothetical protein
LTTHGSRAQEESLFRGLLLRLPGEDETGTAAADADAQPSQPPLAVAAVSAPHDSVEPMIVPRERETNATPLTEWKGVLARGELPEQLGLFLLFILFHLDIIHRNTVFRKPVFLVLAAIVGLSCQAACVGTRSLWPGILMHWLWVAAWKTVA